MRRFALAPLILALGLPLLADNHKKIRLPTIEEAKYFSNEVIKKECINKKNIQECESKYVTKKFKLAEQIFFSCEKLPDPNGCKSFELYMAGTLDSNRILNQIRNQCKSSKDYMLCFSETESKERTRLEIKRNKEKLILVHKCKEKLDCYYDANGDYYLDKNSFKVTSDDFVVYNQRRYTYPWGVDGTKSKNQNLGKFEEIERIGIDCKNRTRLSLSGNYNLKFSKDVSKQELKNNSSYLMNDQIFKLSCEGKIHPSINKTASQIIFGNMNELDQIQFDLRMNTNSKNKTNPKESKFHEECKNANDYFGCINYKENK
tara:strand:- start:868 stop:1818 length:951 start_codon:yes stop_codon:yes gene_type:complete